MPERTAVGIPFHEKEGQGVLDKTLGNINTCLNALQVDAPVVVLVNGQKTATGSPPPLQVHQSRYNAEVSLRYGRTTGQVNAINNLVGISARRGLDRVFITDADIYRFPNSMASMWEQDTPLVGANYTVYPEQIVDQEYRPMTPTERFFYSVFEGDKPPQVKKIIEKYTGKQPTRIKGSLMLVNTDLAHEMHGNQTLASDSIINRVTSADQATIAPDAYFMHYGRISIEDHIKARLRHYRGAAAHGDLEGFRKSQVQISPQLADVIAWDIRSNLHDGNNLATKFLLRTALRLAVDKACTAIVETGHYEPEQPLPTESRANFASAQELINTYLAELNWDEIQGYSITPAETTQQDMPRGAVDLSKYVRDPRYKRTIQNSLGVADIERL